MFPLVDTMPVIGNILDTSSQWAATFWGLTIKATVLLLAVGLANLILQRGSAATRHLLWTVGIISVTLLPLLSAGLPGWEVDFLPQTSVWHQADMSSQPASVVMVSSENPAETVVMSPTRSNSSSVIPSKLTAGPQITLEPRAGNQVQPLGTADQQSVTVTLSTNPFSRMARALENLVRLPGVVWLFFLWQAGALLLLTILLTGFLRLTYLKHKAAPVQDENWLSLLQTLTSELDIHEPVRLLRSDRAVTPMTWGVYRPVVMLPVTCLEWTAEQRREVLVHELAHVRRRDCLTQGFAQVACIVYWFNPLVWLAARRMRVERERACDDRVLLAGARPSSYAGHLLQIACSLGAERRTAGASLAMARRSQMAGRLLALLDPGLRRSAPGRTAAVVIVALVLGVALPLAALSPAAVGTWEKPAQEEPAEPVVPAPPTAPVVVAQPPSTTSTAELPEPDQQPAPASRESRSTRVNSSSSYSGSANWVYNDDDHSVELKVKGEIKFNDGETDIAWMSDGARFELTENKDGRKRRMKIEPGEDGVPEHHYYEGRQEKPYDEEAQAWFAEVFEDAVRDLGIATEARVRRIYEQEGIDELLQEISEVQSDHAQAMYYQEALRLKMMATEEKARAMEQAARELESDFAKSQFLMQAQREANLMSEEMLRQAYLTMAASIDSDFEKGRTLQAALDSGELTPEDVSVLLSAAEDIDSDFELAKVLTSIEPDELDAPEMRQAYFKATASIDSDFERGRVLAHVLETDAADSETVLMALESLQDMDSDFERTKILNLCTTNLGDDERYLELYFAAVDDMDSDFERSKALMTLLEADILTTTWLVRTLQSAAKLDSDFEKSRVLVEVAPHCTPDNGLEEAYEDAADTIDSEFEYGKVMKALRKSLKSI